MTDKQEWIENELIETRISIDFYIRKLELYETRDVEFKSEKIHTASRILNECYAYMRKLENQLLGLNEKRTAGEATPTIREQKNSILSI